MRNLTKLRFVLFIGLLFYTPLTIGSQEYTSDVVIFEIPIEDDLHMADHLAINIIKSIEGFKSKPYIGPGGKKIIGYGFTNRKETSLTRKESDIILIKIYKSTRSQVQENIKHDNLTRYQIAALTSFAYSVGIGAFQRSTLLRRINKEKFESVNYELSRWTKVRNGDEVKELAGLVKRRKLEGELWEGNYSGTF